MEFFDFTIIADRLCQLITGDPYYTYYWACLIAGAVGFAVTYSLEAVALYTIAKNNGYEKRWMAFVPFFNTYYIGVLAEKNKTFNTKTKNFSLALAIMEVVCAALYILHMVSIFLLFSGNYLKAIPENFYNTAGELIATVFTGKYEITGLPANLEWAWWVFSSMESYILSTLELATLVLSVFVLSSFFRTYSARNYMVFTILSIIFPIKTIFMFCVRKNKAKNYVDYLRERQKRQYDAYQQYMRNNGGYNNPNGGYNNPNGGYYGGGAPNGGAGGARPTPEDPFGGLGQQGGNPPPDDPFDDVK